MIFTVHESVNNWRGTKPCKTRVFGRKIKYKKRKWIGIEKIYISVWRVLFLYAFFFFWHFETVVSKKKIRNRYSYFIFYTFFHLNSNAVLSTASPNEVTVPSLWLPGRHTHMYHYRGKIKTSLTVENYIVKIVFLCPEIERYDLKRRNIIPVDAPLAWTAALHLDIMMILYLRRERPFVLLRFNY